MNPAFFFIFLVPGYSNFAQLVPWRRATSLPLTLFFKEPKKRCVILTTILECNVIRGTIRMKLIAPENQGISLCEPAYLLCNGE